MKQTTVEWLRGSKRYQRGVGTRRILAACGERGKVLVSCARHGSTDFVDMYQVLKQTENEYKLGLL